MGFVVDESHMTESRLYSERLLHRHSDVVHPPSNSEL